MNKFVIKNPEGQFIFGNKTFTTNPRLARVFNTREEAEYHLRQWYLPTSVVEPVS